MNIITAGQWKFFHDHEVFSEADLTDVGPDAYSNHPTTRVQMTAWTLFKGETIDFIRERRPIQQWDESSGKRYPREVKGAIEDDAVHKHAFNAQFERIIARNVLGLRSNVFSWRCTMALAYSQSFSGGLDDIGEQIGLPAQYLKSKEGKALLRMFAWPQKRVTKTQPNRIRDWRSDPEAWERYCFYNRQDVEAEMAVDARLGRFGWDDSEVYLYGIDQVVNDRGLPVDMQFVTNAKLMADRRRDELQGKIRDITGVENANSTAQLLAWLQPRGYWFDDMRADTVQKVLRESKDDVLRLQPEAIEVLKLREWASRSSPEKFDKFKAWCVGARARYMFQFGGASRTNRWAGRGPQPQNLPRGHKSLEDETGERVRVVSDIIKSADYDDLCMWDDEPLRPIVGSLRSSFQAPEGHEFVVCDLAAIESRVIGWLCQCLRLMKVFSDDLDPYKDFATVLYDVVYALVTKKQRGDSKPAVLGAGYRLGGGDLHHGKRTGLWGYAENMGVDLPKEESHRMVQLFRDRYVEIPQGWYDIERAVAKCIISGQPTTWRFIRFEMRGPYMVAILPSGRPLYYHEPVANPVTKISRRGNPYTAYEISYMGKSQATHQWERLESHGGLLIENFVQALARDVLKVGMIRAHEFGFNIVGHVHDELIALQRIGDNRFTKEALRMCMRFPIHWAPGLLLDASASTFSIYRKD